MSGISRKRLVQISSPLTVAFVLGLMLLINATAATDPVEASPQSRRVVHHVSAGGPDACGAIGFEHPGCDGNWSLTVIEYSDGTVSGQYNDRFANGDGVHAVIDCLRVEGNQAWVSGVVTHGRFTDPDTGEEFDPSGLPFSTTVKDNGTSAGDPPDQISFTFLGLTCNDNFDFPLLDTPQGQVRVR